MDAFVEPSLLPFDFARRLGLRLGGRLLAPLLAKRDARLLWLGLLGCTLSFALSVRFPYELLLIGPLVFGVPHLLADLRYLVCSERFRSVRGSLIPGALLLVALTFTRRIELGFAAAGVFFACARGESWKRTLGALAFATLAGTAWLSPRATSLMFAHAHNLVAIVAWVLLARRVRRAHAVFVGTFVLLSIAMFSGTFDFVLRESGHHDALARFARVLSPTTDRTWSARFVSFFAFAQSVHYSIWLRQVPDETREREGVRSFRSSYRALVRDVGRPVVALAIALAAGLLVYACVHATAARDLYLRLAISHGYLELGALAWLSLGRRAA